MAVPRPLRLTSTLHDHRVTTFELFFDLVYVFAFTQVSGLMVHAHDAAGVAQGLVVLGLLWWTWAAYSWLANEARADRGLLLAAMALAMAAVFVVALEIPDAFEEGEAGRAAAIVLVTAYGVVRLVHIAVYLLAAGADRALRRQVLISLGAALLPSLALLAIGALLGGAIQLLVWAAAWLLDVLVVFLTSLRGSWRLPAAGHWAERYGLVVILALGESVVAIGVGAAEEEVSLPLLAGALLAIGGSIALWWAYFRSVAARAEHRLAALPPAERPLRASEGYTYAHFPIVAGIVLAAVGVEEAMHRIPLGEPLGLFGALALTGGTSLVLAATALFSAVVARRALVPRLVVGLALLPTAVGIAALPALAAFAIPVAATVAALALESTLDRRAQSSGIGLEEDSAS